MSGLSFERAIAFAQDLIRTPGLPGKEKEVADRVLAEYELLGYDEFYRDDVGNAIGIVRGRGEKPPLMLSSHLDVVDVGDAASWEYPPFSGAIEDGHLHGRGAMDIKGPLALQTYAAAHFLKDRPAGDVIVAHTIMEERGGWGMEWIMKQGKLVPGAVIIGEATNGDICVGHRGRAEMIIEIQGLAGHASAPLRARNPIELLPIVLPVLKEFAQQQGSVPMLGSATIAPTAIETLPRSRNVIPDQVRIVADWRILPGRTAEDLASELSDFLKARVTPPEGWSVRVYYSVEPQQTYTGMTRERRMYTAGFLMPADHVVVQTAVTTITQQTGRKPELRPWSFATDGGHTCGIHGIPTIGFAPGEERYAHTNRERLKLKSARTCYDAYPQLMRAVQSAV